jgi:hypothetical protein
MADILKRKLLSAKFLTQPISRSSKVLITFIIPPFGKFLDFPQPICSQAKICGKMMCLISTRPTYRRGFITGVLKVWSKSITPDVRVFGLDSKLRATLAGCRVTMHQHLDETVSITFGPHLVGRFQADGQVLNRTKPAVEMMPPRKATKAVASRSGLEKSRSKAA